MKELLHLRDLAERFFEKVHKIPFYECWEWAGSIQGGGYGNMAVEGRTRKAHHISLMLAGVTIPTGMVVDHKCRNRACVNPNHLRIVTYQINNIENSLGMSAVHAQKTHCHNGHPFSGDNLRTYKRKDGLERICRICQRENNKLGMRVWRARQKERG